MLLKDYECGSCGSVEEVFMEWKDMPDFRICPACGCASTKTITLNHTAPVDCSWIGTVSEVVDKSPNAPVHCKEFLKHPTRANYKSWMRGEGLRPLESGEKSTVVDKTARRKKIKKGILEKHMERNAVSV